jgi:hypothetical protein
MRKRDLMGTGPGSRFFLREQGDPPFFFIGAGFVKTASSPYGLSPKERLKCYYKMVICVFEK